MDNEKYILTYTGDVYKKLDTHFLKLSPWCDGEDRRMYEIDNNNYHTITYKNACMIINKQFDETTEEWTHNGKKYIADAIQCTDVNKYASLLQLLPSHAALTESKKLLNKIGNDTLTIDSENGLTQLKLVKHKGKIYYILIINKDLPRVRAYNVFGEFLQWCNIKHCKPIYNGEDKKFI